MSRTAFGSAPAALCVVTAALAADAGAPPPWDVNEPIVMLEKTVHIECTDPTAAAWCDTGYIGPGLDRFLIRGEERSSDRPTDPRVRFSGDNGRTWTEPMPLRDQVQQYQGISATESPWPNPLIYDPNSEMVVGFALRQMVVDERYHEFAYYTLSADLGMTWRERKHLRYEAGAEFDPENPTDPEYLDNNRGMQGCGTLLHSNGTLIHPLCLANIPKDAPDPNPQKLEHWHVHGDSRAIGSLCMIGRWNAEKQDYDWTGGSPVWVPRDVSIRGLLEPDIAELEGGRVLVVWRGSNTATTPGHKWYGISSDGGKTFGEVTAWTYDDGTPFFSPSSSHNFLLHSSGRLYWLGNICGPPPSGNDPRYPLVIGEVDQRTGLLKKDTVTAIDDRQPHHGPQIQFSNCKFFENRETHAIEIYLTAYGENTDDWRHANCYKYTLTPQ